jgi:opacity protein-like surface antigen
LARFGGGAGVSLFPNEKFSIDFGVGYNAFLSKDTIDDFQGNSVEEKETTSGLTIDVGFSVFIGK